MNKNLFRYLGIFLIWVIPALSYFNYPNTIYFVLVSIPIFIFILVWVIIKLAKDDYFDRNIIKYILLFSISILGVICGFVIEANNLEANKQFINFTFVDFIFPISIISSASIPATYLIFSKK